MKRNNHVNITVGKRGSGKTFRTKQLINNSQLKTIIIDTFDHESYRDYKNVAPKMIDDRAWISGTIRCYGYNFEDVFYQLSNKISNTLIVFEDCTKYIRDRIVEDIIRLVTDTKQKNIDIIFMYHGFGMVRPDLYRLADSITIFKTNEDVNRYRSKIPNFETVKKINDHIQQSKNPYINQTVWLN